MAGGVIFSHTPVEIVYLQTDPAVAFPGPDEFENVRYKYPEAISPLKASTPVGCPGTTVHVLPPSLERKRLRPVVSSTDAKSLCVALPVVPVVLSNMTKFMSAVVLMVGVPA